MYYFIKLGKKLIPFAETSTVATLHNITVTIYEFSCPSSTDPNRFCPVAVDTRSEGNFG